MAYSALSVAGITRQLVRLSVGIEKGVRADGRFRAIARFREVELFLAA